LFTLETAKNKSPRGKPRGDFILRLCDPPLITQIEEAAALSIIHRDQDRFSLPLLQWARSLALLGVKDHLHAKNKSRFIEFLELEIPSRVRGANLFQLTDARKGQQRQWSVAEILYEIRCMIHENENLDESDPLDHHILLRWHDSSDVFICSHENGRVVINARLLWRRLREIVSKFITGIEAYEAMANDQGFRVTIRPALGTIQPEHRRKGKRA
jgi:hypothetical protein